MSRLEIRKIKRPIRDLGGSSALTRRTEKLTVIESKKFMSYTNGNGNGRAPNPKNVLGGDLQNCCTDPMTGFYRDGYCRTGVDDTGRHTICIEATDDFLAFSKAAGNDLSTPMPQYAFPGLKAGDKWCLCMLRWREALEQGVAPRVYLEATHEAALTVVGLDDLKRHAAAAE